MISLSDAQLDVVLRGALLAQRAGRFGDADVITAMEVWLRSLQAAA